MLITFPQNMIPTFCKKWLNITAIAIKKQYIKDIETWKKTWHEKKKHNKRYIYVT